MIYPEIKDTEGKLIEYPISDDETVLEATFEAFEAIDFDVVGQETPIKSWIGDCAMTKINWNSEVNCRLTTVIWDHPTVVTSETVTIFAPPIGYDAAREQRSIPGESKGT